MVSEISLLASEKLKEKIYTIRGIQVMLDVDLAIIYGYTTKRFNEQVKNNIERFDDDFRFQLTDDEVDNLRSKFSTAKAAGETNNISSMSRSNPFAFTERGVYENINL